MNSIAPWDQPDPEEREYTFKSRDGATLTLNACENGSGVVFYLEGIDVTRAVCQQVGFEWVREVELDLRIRRDL
jgi:hypothetical protein